MMKILIADDEQDILEILRYNLVSNGFYVFEAQNGKDAIELATKEKPDLIVLDIMMPYIDGIEVCRTLRENSDFNNTIIVFLSARSEDYSHIAGLEAGADDYLLKPIKPKLFIAKIKNLLKRKGALNETTNSKQFGNITIDYDQRLIIINNESVLLPRKEFKIISLLSSKPGKVFTREEMYGHIWGNDICVSDRTLDVHIRKIREKLGDNLIATIKGVGYKFQF